MLVNIDNDTALEMLVNRLKFWSDDADVITLYERQRYALQVAKVL